MHRAGCRWQNFSKKLLPRNQHRPELVALASEIGLPEDWRLLARTPEFVCFANYEWWVTQNVWVS